MARAKRFCYEYPRPMVTVDCVALRASEGEIEALLVRRKHSPFQDRWALPGGFIGMSETLEYAVLRELEEETGLSDPNVLHQFGSYSDPKRDPRGRVISFAFLAIFDGQAMPVAGDDAAETEWFSTSKCPVLAFDHLHILREGIACLRFGVMLRGWLLAFLPPRFRAEQLWPLMASVPGLTMTAEEYIEKSLKNGMARRARPKGAYEFIVRE